MISIFISLYIYISIWLCRYKVYYHESKGRKPTIRTKIKQQQQRSAIWFLANNNNVEAADWLVASAVDDIYALEDDSDE